MTAFPHNTCWKQVTDTSAAPSRMTSSEDLTRVVWTIDLEMRDQTVRTMHVFYDPVPCIGKDQLGKACDNTRKRSRKHLEDPYSNKLLDIHDRNLNCEFHVSPRAMSWEILQHIRIQVSRTSTDRRCVNVFFRTLPASYHLYEHAERVGSHTTHLECATTVQKRKKFCEIRETFLSRLFCIDGSRILRLLQGGNFRDNNPCGCEDSQSQPIVGSYKTAGRPIVCGTNNMRKASLRKEGGHFHFPGVEPRVHHH